MVGAGGTSIVLLERLLSQLQANDAAYYGLLVGYPPDGSSGAGQGVQTDAAANVTLGIAQVNLSTETRPPAGLAMAAMLEKALEQPELTLLNPPSEFVRLLWEASITRSSGFFLYYYDRASGADCRSTCSTIATKRPSRSSSSTRSPRSRRSRIAWQAT